MRRVVQLNVRERDHAVSLAAIIKFALNSEKKIRSVGNRWGNFASAPCEVKSMFTGPMVLIKRTSRAREVWFALQFKRNI